MTAAERYLRRRLPVLPDTVVVLGSGLGEADLGRESARVPYARVPGFPRPRVPGHPGALSMVGRTAVLRGRIHYYEGHALEEVVEPVRTLARLGARTLILTNAAGGIAAGLKPGDLMGIVDHLNLMGANPLRGAPRFADLTEVYDVDLLRRAERVARGLGFRLKKGVYAAVAGPSYETPAEVRMLKRLGADAVGMSTVPEAIAAAHAGMKVLALSLIANRAAGAGRPVSHAEVLVRAKAAGARTAALLRGILRG
ncbi:MAG TPA: purine-nucleoside phosphorylase [Planctomycetota bacterium]